MIGAEASGQMYSLAMEGDIQDSALKMYDEDQKRIDELDRQMRSGQLTQAELSANISEYATREARVRDLGRYCTYQGLIESFAEA